MVTTDQVSAVLRVDSRANAPGKRELKVLMEAAPENLDTTILRPGNTKLGPKIAVWGIPAVASCPGRSKTCESLCYATKAFYTYTGPVRSRHVNFALANRPDFAAVVNAALKTSKREIVRVHDSGDLFSVAYTRAWVDVMRANPGVKFFLFTRSWRVADIVPVLEEMATLKNVRLWYSIDRETGFPPKIPKRVRLAYLQVEPTDLPARQVDLVFRDSKVRGATVKKVNDALVCPYENGVTKAGTESVDTKRKGQFSCSTCGLCWADLDGPKDPRTHHGKVVKGTGRVPLGVLVPTI